MKKISILFSFFFVDSQSIARHCFKYLKETCLFFNRFDFMQGDPKDANAWDSGYCRNLLPKFLHLYIPTRIYRNT